MARTVGNNTLVTKSEAQALVGSGSTLLLTNRQTASYTLVLGDADKLVEINSASATNVTIPLNATVAYPIGTQILISQYGAGVPTVVPTGGVTIRTEANSLAIAARYGIASFVKIATDEWYASGSLGTGASVASITSSATPTPDISTYVMLTISALAVDAVFGAPTGTPVEGQKLVIRVEDNGTPRALSFNAIYRFGTDVTAPTITVSGKVLYLGCIYHATDNKWDVIAKSGGY